MLSGEACYCHMMSDGCVSAWPKSLAALLQWWNFNFWAQGQADQIGRSLLLTLGSVSVWLALTRTFKPKRSSSAAFTGRLIRASIIWRVWRPCPWPALRW